MKVYARMISGLPAPGAVGFGLCAERQAGIGDLIDVGDVAQLQAPFDVVQRLQDLIVRIDLWLRQNQRRENSETRENSHQR